MNELSSLLSLVPRFHWDSFTEIDHTGNKSLFLALLLFRQDGMPFFLLRCPLFVPLTKAFNRAELRE